MDWKDKLSYYKGDNGVIQTNVDGQSQWDPNDCDNY